MFEKEILSEIDKAMDDLILLREVIENDFTIGKYGSLNEPIRGSKALVNRIRQQINLKLTLLAPKLDVYTYNSKVDNVRKQIKERNKKK